jgi:hypothetical protein
MAQQSDEQFLQEHYQWFQKSDHWHDKALSLRAMANALYSKALPGLRRYEKARKAAQKELRDRSVVPIKAVEPDILPAIALYGAALENALKGLMVSQEPTLKARASCLRSLEATNWSSWSALPEYPSHPTNNIC